MRPNSSPGKITPANLIVVVILIIGIITLFKFSNIQLPLLKPRVSPTPEAVYRPAPLPHGKQEYNVSRGAGGKGPTITQVTFDPLDPKQGENITVRVKVKYTQAVTAVTVAFKTDNKEKTYPLKLKEGDATNGTWEETWKIGDTYENFYVFKIETAAADEKSSIDYPFRSP